jgi:SSS family solute:Na+ symporter
MTAARNTPILASFPKMFIPFIVVIPGMIAGVLVPEVSKLKAGAKGSDVTYNDAILLLIRDVLPTGLLGLALTGLLAAFMAGMAANISAFNTVFSYDLWQRYVKQGRSDGYYLKVGRWATVGATILAIGTAFIASGYGNLMNYLQTLFGFFNAPLFATFILGILWKRMTPTAGWAGLVSGTLGAVTVWLLNELDVYSLPGQGAAFISAGTAFVVDIAVSIPVSLMTAPKPVGELDGLIFSKRAKVRDTDEAGKRLPWYQAPAKLAGVSLVLVTALNLIFR